jgi:glycerol uptake operon antiterminator
MELMPGVIPKLIRRFSVSSIPVIAGGLVEHKSEVTEALASGAVAVSTGAKQLWDI